MQTRLNAISGDQSGRKTCLIVRKFACQPPLFALVRRASQLARTPVSRTFNSRLVRGAAPPPLRLGFFLPAPPVLAQFSGLASRAPPLQSRRFCPHRRLSVLRFLWWLRERSRGHFLCWRWVRRAHSSDVFNYIEMLYKPRRVPPASQGNFRIRRYSGRSFSS